MSKNWFRRSEFSCKCGCGFSVVDFELLEVLNLVRRVFEIPIVISSGARCPKHNVKEGGATNSMHLTGMAADFRPKLDHPKFNYMLEEMHEFLLKKFPDRYGIARGNSFIHIDTKPGPKRRWKY